MFHLREGDHLVTQGLRGEAEIGLGVLFLREVSVMVEQIGADRLLWGTDMPFQNRFCTYRQSRQWIEKYCDFLSSDDLAQVMGGTARRILNL